MKIGISGASGQLGKTVLAELKVRGGHHSAVGISRTPETVQSPAEGRHGDYDRPDTLTKAYEGVKRLLIIPAADVRPGARGRQFAAAIDAAVNSGVEHIVLISSAATREAEEPEMFAPYWTAEQHLIRTAPRWTILRMNYYAESLAQTASMSLRSGILPGLGESRVAFVSRDDLAAAAAGILLGEGHAGAFYNATGPDAVTGAQRAALMSEMSGKPLHFTVLDEAQLRGGLVQAGIPKEYIDAMIDIEKHFVAGDFNIVTGDVERLAGRRPRSLREVLKATPK
ncbi:NAD(P)H dehydrogenase (quinone) [Paraburkholderia sp. BL27I4N3]|uniref:SDR family oxidoreductase n=1 Tax=Paraburkholderia sp. BL27I4N3 TaxID=1938805 RepID=UPI000E2599EC|nr:SDR family oxidoreductase [Paraburkholderia sp. BL27I4N3]REE06501.1 NAD(P)H dehydrogenase (quinone) [Paraburkholderia sp. BL27I4N3]